MKLEIFIPLLPPGINRDYGIGRHGKIYKTNEAKAWSSSAALLIGAKAGQIGWEDHGGEFEIEIVCSQMSHDVDSPIKLIIDTVSLKLGFDDKRVRAQSSRREDLGDKGIMIILRQA